MTGKNMLPVSFLIATVVLAVFFYYKDKNNGSFAALEIKGKILKVELADNPLKQARGLSGRLNLPPDQGMFFIFDSPGYHPFWMKDMRFPIDVLWIGTGYRVVDISPKIEPGSYPKSFRPKLPAQFVLEVPAGWTEENSITIGESVKLVDNH